MNRVDSKFYVRFGILFLSISAIILILQKVKPSVVESPIVWYSQIFMFSIIILSHWVSAKGLKNKAIDFHLFYMASMGFRFLLSVIYLFILVFCVTTGLWVIIINFFLLYFLYTSFEIYSLMSNLRAEN